MKKYDRIAMMLELKSKNFQGEIFFLLPLRREPEIATKYGVSKCRTWRFEKKRGIQSRTGRQNRSQVGKPAPEVPKKYPG